MPELEGIAGSDCVGWRVRPRATSEVSGEGGEHGEKVEEECGCELLVDRSSLALHLCANCTHVAWPYFQHSEVRLEHRQECHVACHRYRPWSLQQKDALSVCDRATACRSPGF